MQRVVVVAVVALILAPTVAGVAVAQDGTNTTAANTTTTETPSATDTQSGEDANTDANPGEDDEETTETPVNGSEDEYEQRIDRFTVLESSEYDENTEQWTLVIRSEEPGTITFTPSIDREDGSGTFSIYQERTSRGTVTVTVPAPLVDGKAGLNIVSDRGIDEQRGVYVQHGDDGENPFTDWDPVTALLLGSIVSITMFVIAAVRELKSETGEPRPARSP